MQHPAGEVGGPAHASRQRAHRIVAALAEPELADQRVDARHGESRGQVPQAGGEAEVLLHGEVAVERGVLEHEADGAPHGEVVLGHVVPHDPRRPPGRREQRGEQMDRGGLAGAVRPEQAEELAGSHVEIELLERADRAEILAEPACLDRGGGHPFVASARDAGAAR